MIDAISGAGLRAWPTTNQPQPQASERAAIQIYQAPSERRLATDGVALATDRLITSLQNLALGARAKEIVDAEAPTAPAPLVTSMSARGEIASSATVAFRSSAPEYQVSSAQMVASAPVAPPPTETEEPPVAEEPPTTEEPTAPGGSGGSSGGGGGLLGLFR